MALSHTFGLSHLGTQILAFQGTVSRIKWAKFWKRSGQVVSSEIMCKVDPAKFWIPRDCFSRAQITQVVDPGTWYHPQVSDIWMTDDHGWSCLGRPSMTIWGTHGSGPPIGRFQSKSWAVLHLAPRPPRC